MGVDSLYRVGDGCCSVFKCIPHNNGSSTTEKKQQGSLQGDFPAMRRAAAHANSLWSCCKYSDLF